MLRHAPPAGESGRPMTGPRNPGQSRNDSQGPSLRRSTCDEANPCRHTKNGWIASRSLSSGAHFARPLACNDSSLDMPYKYRGVIRRALLKIFLNLPIRGRWECRAPMRRAKSVQVATVTPESPRIPRANGFTFLRSLPGDRLFCHVTCGTYRRLTPASRCQDYTIHRPQLQSSSARRLRPSHPAPNVRRSRNALRMGGTRWILD